MICRALAIIGFLPCLASAGTFKTSGTCSPIIEKNTGSITISCPGISASQAEQITKLLNKILDQKLDLQVVLKKLDDIHQKVLPQLYPVDPINLEMMPPAIQMQDGGYEYHYKVRWSATFPHVWQLWACGDSIKSIDVYPAALLDGRGTRDNCAFFNLRNPVGEYTIKVFTDKETHISLENEFFD